ncbi:helix-turn-helix transcriptional regulator [Rhizobium puerariae]|uniref:Helix-turn-helix transcriptional regulator n=1 Tax=Rhizobium puerariae TaxID=1585791 RepID=A0ABV6AS36_9HYPH
MERQRFYTLQQLIKLYGFSRQHFYNEHARGRLVMRKAGSRTVVLAEDLDAWVKTFETLPVDQAVAA